jgi:hypothetical protein
VESVRVFSDESFSQIYQAPPYGAACSAGHARVPAGLKSGDPLFFPKIPTTEKPGLHEKPFEHFVRDSSS